MKPVPQMLTLVFCVVFLVLGYFAGLNHADRGSQTDLNNDGQVTFEDFSIALYLLNAVTEDLEYQSKQLEAHTYQPSN